MTATVLCLNPPSAKGFIRNGRWTRQSRGNQSWYPIFLSYLCGFLQKHNFNVGILDASTQNMSEDICYLYITKVLQPTTIFYYWSFDSLQSDLAFADRLAQYSQVVLVGPWSLCAPEALLQTKNVHIMSYGEFEYTCLDILKGTPVSKIQGIIWRDVQNVLHTNPSRPLCSTQELDNMSFVTQIYSEFLNIKNYHQTSLKFPFIDLFGSRGCPGGKYGACTYCQWVQAFQGGPSYRSRSIKNIIEELWFIKNNLPEVKQIFFQDDTLPQKHVIELSLAISNEKLNICWGGYSRAELSFDTLKLMKESGCRTLHIGYESPIQENLDIIHKGLTVEQMKEFATNIKKLNMWTSATFMLFPWMTPEEIKFTINWAKSIKPKRMNFIQAQGYPNTQYAEMIKQFTNHPDIIIPSNTPRFVGKLMSFEEMKKWEQWGFKQFYIYNPHFWIEVLSHPKEWKNVYQDAKGLLQFLN